jgi:ubiquinone/menaquinone biosynthesis C-methylase UbiE
LVSRQKLWDRIYSTQVLEEMSWFQSHPALSIELIERSGVGPGAPIVDVGGGDSLLVDRLLELGYRDLTVLDVSAAALDRAQRRLGDRAESVRWIANDVTRFRPEHKYDIWHDRAVFHFLTDAEDRQRYVDVMKKALVDGGRAIVATFSLDGPPMCSGLEVRRYSTQTLTEELCPAFELVESREQVHRTPTGKSQSFVYGRFVKAA